MTDLTAFFLFIVLMGFGLKMIASIVKASDKSIETIAQKRAEQFKTCPYCAENVKVDAKICRYCSKEFS
jgi:putative Mn2+ efflux pump MntP